MLRLQKVSRFKKQSSRNRSNKKQPFKYPKQQQYPQFQEEFDPRFIHGHFVEKENQGYLRNSYEAKYSDRQFEDSVLTGFIHQKIVLTQYTMMCLGIISILLSIVGHELQGVQQHTLIIHSLITICMIVMLLIRYRLRQQLRVKQLMREKFQNKCRKFIKETFIQLIILIMHPNSITEHLIVNVSEPMDGGMIGLRVNVLFEILMQLRIYLLFSSIIASSVYCSTRANRLCRIYSTKNNLFFGIKALFEYRPLTFLILLYTGLVVALGQMISLSERDYQQRFAIFENSVWFVIITMGTVGYGDYSPITYLGRMISFTGAISGIIISSLLVLTLSRYLSMSTGEKKSHMTLKRLQLRQLLQKYSEQTINFTSRIILSTNKNDRINNEQPTKRAIQEQLKKKTERVKFCLRRIKNTIDSDNLREEINRLFEVLSESLNLIYKHQEEYSELLVELYHKEKELINSTKFSFTLELQSIIKDR